MSLKKIIGLFDNKKYAKLALNKSKIYKKNRPFPHISIKNFLDNNVANTLFKKFPNYNSNKWIDYESYGRNKNTNFKKSIDKEFILPQEIRAFLREVNSRQFILFLETLTGIDGLIADPYYMGGGCHISKEKGYLNIHKDFNWHHKLQLHRRVNALFYLTPDWKKEFNGSLELWSKNKKIKEYAPLFNSCLIFNTTEKSFHGHPKPIVGKKTFRRVLNLYYYTVNNKSNEIVKPHFTDYTFKKNPNKFSNKLKSVKNSPWANQLLKNYMDI